MKTSVLAIALALSIPFALAWLIYREIQWERRSGFHGTYDQPVEPRSVVDLDGEYEWAERGRRVR